MTQSLDKLLEIARAATPGPWKVEPTGMGNSFSTVVAPNFGQIIGSHNHTPHIHHNEAAYIATFNPRLIEKLLAEVIASRFVDAFVLEGSSPALVKREMRLYEAREALDAELSPKE